MRRALALAVLLALVVVGGCGTVDAVEYRPETEPTATATSVAWADLPRSTDALCAFGADGDAGKKDAIAARASAIGAGLLAAPEAVAAPDRVQRLRTRILTYAAAYPDDRQRNAARLAEVRASLPALKHRVM